MKTTDFYQPLSSTKLNENIAKQFGGRVNLNKYNRETLEDMRNKLRTRIFQQESQAGVNDLLTNETYQKDQAMLQLLNTRIKEMLGEDIKKLRDKIDQLSEAKKGVKAPKYTAKAKGAKPDFLDLDKDGNKTEPMKSAAKSAKVKEGAKPDFLDLDKDGNKKEPMKKAAKDAKSGKPFQEAMKKKCCCATKGEDSCPVHGMKEGSDWKELGKDWSPSAPQPKGHKGQTQGKRYGGGGQKDKPEHDTEKKVKESKSCANGHTKMTKGCDECMGMWESTGDYSAKKAAAGKDIGKPGKNFSKIAKDAGQRYGSKAAGERVAGAVLAKMRAKESVENFRHNVKFVNESLSYLLQEDEEGKAKTITAASDIVNDYTSWMQRVGQYQTKAIIELADAIKADFGQAEAETFKQSVAPALSATLETLTQQREAISSAVAVLAGEAAPEEPMGMEPDMGADANAGLDMPPPDDMNTPPQAGDEFGAADAAAGDGTTGREMRESREQRRARKLAEEHSIISRLAK